VRQKSTHAWLSKGSATLHPRIAFALKRRSHFMPYPVLLFKGSAAFRRFALALCSRYSGTRSALTGFAGSQTGAFLQWTKAIKGRANILPHKSSKILDVGGSLRGFAFR
jgi:hypothetical protein